MDYSRLTALLIEAVKQQQREIAALQKRAAKLESTVAKLKHGRTESTQLAARLAP